MVAERRQLDNTIEIVTPENIAFRYQVAGPFRRLPAYLIDLGIRAGLFLGVTLFVMIVFGLAGLPIPGLGLTLVFLFALEWFYGGLFEAFWNGQTPGKRLLRIRVLTIDGQPISGLQAVLRNVLRVVDQQPVTFCLLGLVAAALNDRFQRLGDLACGTMVVLEERPWFFREDGVIRVDHPEAIRLAGEVPASFQASPTLARTLANYVERRAYFPPLRRLEIALQLAEPLREQFDFPPNTNPDLLLCALYRRTFITDKDEESSTLPGSPFQEAGSPFAPSEATATESENKNENAAAARDQPNLTWSATEK
ncbi:MAG: RDD family protein [Planctomycetota bacterium]